MITPIDPALVQAAVESDLHVDPAGVVRWRGELVPSTDEQTLRTVLTSFIYGDLHSGIDRARPQTGLHKSGADRALGHAVADATPHRSRRARVPSGATYDNGDLLVRLSSVRVRIPKSRIISRGPAGLATVDLPAGRPNLSTGFHYVFGTRPLQAARDVLRVYLHIPDAGAAPAVWSSILCLLEDARASYDAKILTRVREYPRRDAMVVYLDANCVRTVADIACLTRGLDLGGETSVFTRRVAPGVGVAWEPDPSGLAGSQKQSFGEHRAGCVARALLRWYEPSIASRTFDAELVDAFAAENIDPSRVYRNFRSPTLTIESAGAT